MATGRRAGRKDKQARGISSQPSEIESMPVSNDPIATRSAARVRAASEANMEAVREIYAHYVVSSLATFEETPPTLEEMLARRRASVELGLPYLVAEAGGEIVGFAYAAAYRARPAYRFTIEDSVYVADGLAGGGIGSALLGELIAGCERGPWRQMLAVVGDSANTGSIALHQRLGFELVGMLRSVGFKFGRWVDTPILQRGLGLGGEQPP
jgi:phosphinothricin acetyltransferase